MTAALDSRFLTQGMRDAKHMQNQLAALQNKPVGGWMGGWMKPKRPYSALSVSCVLLTPVTGATRSRNWNGTRRGTR